MALPILPLQVAKDVFGSEDIDAVQKVQAKEGRFDKYVKPVSPPAPAAPSPTPQVGTTNRFGKYVSTTPQEQPAGPKGFWGTLKNPLYLLTHESIPANIAKGIKRLASGEKVSPIEAIAGQQGAAGIEAFRKDPKGTMSALADFAVKNPGTMAAELINGILADPELLFVPQALGGTLAAKLGLAGIKAGEASVRTISPAGRMLESAVVGGTIGAGQKAAEQFATGRYDPSSIGTSGIFNAVLGAPLGLMGRGEKFVAPERDVSIKAMPGKPPVENVEAATARALDTSTEALKRDFAEIPKEVRARKMPEDPGKSLGERLLDVAKPAALGGAIGAAAGGYLGVDPKSSAVAGATLGIAPRVLRAVSPVRGTDIAPLVNWYNGQRSVFGWDMFRFQEAMQKMVPNAERRAELAQIIERPTPESLQSLSANEQKFIKAFQDLNAYIGQVGFDEGVLRSLRDNYISHIVEESPETKRRALSVVDQALEKQRTGTGAARFAKQRKYDTFEELNRALQGSGLRIKTMDPAEIAGIYASAMHRAVVQRRVRDALSGAVNDLGQPLVVPAESAGSRYALMDHPIMMGKAVDKDILPALQFVFEARDPNSIVQGLTALNAATKRAAVFGSLFHAKSLADAFIGARGGTGFVDAVNAYKALRRGDHPAIDDLMKGGLMLRRPEEASTKELDDSLNRISRTIDTVTRIPIAGTAAKGIQKFNHAMDKITFDWLQSGFKLSTALSQYETLLQRGVAKEEAARLASSYTNDLFGSLDWFRVANETQSQIGRDVAYAALNPNSRRYLQFLLFAPDWTLSTFRAAYKAMPGAVDSPYLAQMHRNYLLKSALYYLTIANGVNYATTGHSVFTNRDPLRVEISPGKTMQLSKHFNEPMEWLRDPQQVMLNKLGYYPKNIGEILTNREYLSAHGAAPPLDSIPMHMLESMLPIGVKQMMQGPSVQGISGFFGVPIYGKPTEERRAQRAETRREETQRRREDQIRLKQLQE